MPKVLFVGPYRFSFYSSDRMEPPHIHVFRDQTECKFWLNEVVLAKNDGFKVKELRRILKLVETHRDELLERWHEYFGT